MLSTSTCATYGTGALEAYEESLVLSPGNQVAENRLVEIKRRLTRLNQI